MKARLLFTLALAQLCSCEGSPGRAADGAGLVPGGDPAAGTDVLEGRDGQAPGYDSQGQPPEGYSEPLLEDEDISDVKAGFEPANYKEAILELLERRYPTGHFIVTSVKMQNAIEQFAQPGTFSDLVSSLGTVVHELCHIYGFENGQWVNYVFAVRDDLVVTVPSLQTFPRSEIYSDLTPDEQQDMYAKLYLTGDMGNQGFDTLLDEFNAYTHSLFVAYLFLDQKPAYMMTSDRDGLLAFMYFAELYLRRAGAAHPDDYAEIKGDSGHVDLIGTLWQRAVFILDVTQDIEALGINDDAYYAKVFAPENEAVIQAVVGE